MSDDHKRDLHTWIEPELEARIAALVLGEASDFEADELERLMAEKPELRVFKERLEEVHGHLRDVVKPQDNSQWRLSSGRREELMEKLGLEPEEVDEVVPLAGGEQRRESRIRRQGLKVAVMAAACLMMSLLIVPLFLGALQTAGSKSAESALALRSAMDKSERMELSAEMDRAPGAPIVAERMAGEKRIVELDGSRGVIAENHTSGRERGASATLEALRQNLDQAVVPEEAPAEGSGPWSGFGRGNERRDVRPGNGTGVIPETAAAEPAPAPVAAPEALTKATNGPSPEPIPVPDSAGIAGGAFGEGLALGSGGGGGGFNPDAPAPTAKPAMRRATLDSPDDARAETVSPVEEEPEQGQKGNDKAAVTSGIFPVTPALPTGGQSAFVYPTEYEPPELPNSVGKGITNGLRSGDAAVTRDSIDAILNAPQRAADEDDMDADLAGDPFADEAPRTNGAVFSRRGGEQGDVESRGTTYSEYYSRLEGARTEQQGEITEKLQRQLAEVEENFKTEAAKPGQDRFADQEVDALPDAVARVEELAEMKKRVIQKDQDAEEYSLELEGVAADPVEGGTVESRNFVTYARRDDAVDRALESHDYVEAKREYENAQAMLQATKLQHSAKRIGLRIPKNPVTIHEEPKVTAKSGGFLGLGSKTYEGQATLQVNPNLPDLDPFGGTLGQGRKDGELDPQFLAKEARVLLGDTTLKRTVEELDLDKRWKTDEKGAVEKLRELVSTEPVKNTDLFAVRVSSKDEAEAKAITEKVVESYKESRKAMERERAEAALEALDDELRAQEDLVEERRKVLDTIVQAIGIPYMEGKDSGVSDEALYQLGQRQLKEQEWERDQLARQIRMLSELESEELMKYVAGLKLPQNGVDTLYEEYLTAQRELAKAEIAGLGESHPDIEVRRKHLEELENDLETAVANLRDVLSKRLEIVDRRLDTLRNRGVRIDPDTLKSLKVQQEKEEAAQRAAALKDMEQHTADEPFSTFSLHVSDVGFKLAQAALEQGTFPDPAKVRVEEFVNAFDYGDPMPSQDERVACRVEQAAHPFMQQRNVMRIAMRTAAVGRAAGTPLRLTILLDNSGSMDRADRAESVQRAFGLLAGQLTAQDEVTLIGFARTPRLLREDVKGDQARELLEVIARTPSEGGTNLEEALRLGMEKALENHLEGAQNRIILLTDGAANLGDAEPERLSKLVEELRQRGVAFDACGVGADGLNDTILEALTRKGDGRYYFLDRPEDADAGFARQIAGALRPTAKNVKVQVEFNPQRVGHYALYGFEKHELKKEDFRNDSVDAAELAAEEAGVALYHFEALPEGEGDIGTVSVRFQDTATGEMVEQLWPIPYEASPDSVEDAEPSLRLAATAAFLGETLKGSAVGSLVEFPELGRWSRSLQTVYPQSERIGQLVQMIEKVRELSGR